MFAIPWGRQTILGTTDTEYDGALDSLALEQADLDYVLRAGNDVFATDLGEDDVVGAWAGARPLLRGGGAMSDLSRRHTMIASPGGLVTITGGKLTTYRRMAKDVVDLLAARDGLSAQCRTAEIPLGGSGRAYASALGLSDEVATTLTQQQGEAAASVLSLVAGDPALGTALSDAAPHVAAEVVHAARHEGAATLDDVFSRRFRLSLRARDGGLPAALLAARLLAVETGHDEAWAAAQVTAYATVVAAERGVLGRSLAA
jgi:glycerol-3-phosphate dehydrogenase